MGTAKRDRQKANRTARLAAAEEAKQKAQKKRQFIKIGGIVGILLLAALIYSLVSDGGDDSESVATDTSATATTEGAATTPSTAAPTGRTITGETPCPAVEGEERAITFEQAPPMCIDVAKTYTATFKTSAGDIVAVLDTERVPNTTNNFVTLARYGYYEQSTFFRTASSIGIIQGGGLNNQQTPGYSIEDEGGEFEVGGDGLLSKGPFTYEVGDLIMARTPQPNGGGAQFFFAVDERTKNLDAQGTYVTFGKVTEGLDILETILASGGEGDAAPNPAITVENITIAES